MPPVTAEHLRLNEIENVKIDAERVPDSAPDDSRQVQVRFALQDLTDAQRLLTMRSVYPLYVGLADLSIRYAAARVAFVEKALKTYGREAKLFGG